MPEGEAEGKIFSWGGGAEGALPPGCYHFPSLLEAGKGTLNLAMRELRG